MKSILILPLLFFGLLFTSAAHSHCQIPCGIYDDEATFSSMLLDVETIKKSVNAINNSKTEKNQLVRWVMNKEDHANKIKDTAAEYFLAQRIQEGTDKYNEKLASLHRIIVLAMKSKQHSDLAVVRELEDEINKFKKLYFSENKDSK